MQTSPYLSFKGDCEAAFSFYERCLGGTIGPLFRYEGTALTDQVPSDWHDKIMHGSVTVGGVLVMGADIAPERYESPRGFSLSLQLTDVTHAERIFLDLSEGGKVVMPLEQTFWAARFGMVVDQFGIPWLINCDGSAPPD